jgi:hypothetical protein
MKTPAIATLVLAFTFWGCSTPQPSDTRHAAANVQASTPVPAHPELLAQIAKLQPDLAPPSDEGLPEVLKGKPCQLGTSCLAMDPRPFEICLLGTNKRCSDKAREPLQVGNPDAGPR